jgi:sugar phosphate isomerase/epimerase
MSKINRRKFIEASAILGAAGALSSFTGNSFASTKKDDLSKKITKSKITFGTVFGEPGRPPEQLAPGYDYVEIPIELIMLPLTTNAEWEKVKTKIKEWKLPPITSSSHFIAPVPFTGPDVDFELAVFWSKRAFERMAQVGGKIVGIWGQFFKVPDGFSKIKAMDQSLRFLDSIADLAAPYGIYIALEPASGKNSLIPLYKDGIEMCKRVGRPEIKVMADSGYFLELKQPLEDIAKEPELCVHNHISGIDGQPGVGDLKEFHKKHFRVLRDIGYVGGVSAASSFINTKGDNGQMDYRYETEKVLKYMQNIREEVFAE